MARTFRSDNNAGLCPEALQAVLEANDGSHEIGYGDDSHTARAVDAFRRIFGDDVSVWFVATGSAANTLAITSLTQPWQQVIAHVHSHVNADESTAPERFCHCRMVQVRSESGKISPQDFARAAGYTRGDVHQPQPGVLTISNSTEFGLVYQPDEVRDLCKVAHEAGFAVHMDGARFANAVAAAGCHPRELTIEAGVDALSFGGTKNGLAFGEAVLFFPQGDGARFRAAVESFPYHRKSTCHLLSKHRFVAAPFIATLANDAWLRHARHANSMARALSQGLTQLGLRPRFATEANGVFVSLDPHVDEALRARGYGYYPFGEPDWKLFRFMCSFDTSAADVEAFLADIRSAIAR